MSFLGEIKRRKVFQVAAAYAIVGWLLIEVAAVLLPTFQAPDWVMRAFSFVVIAGFPLAVILAWAFDLTPQGIRAASEDQVPDVTAQPVAQRLSYTVQGLILLAVGFLVVDQYLLEPRVGSIAVPSVNAVAGQPVNRFDYELPVGQSFSNPTQSAMALSPDGRHFVYLAEEGLYLRVMGELEARLIAGTEEAGGSPFFSPDGQSVAYRVNDQLKRISINGGVATTITEVPDVSCASWGSDEMILFATRGGIARVSANGGTVEFVIPDENESGERFLCPELLPDGDSVLFSTGDAPSFDTGQIVAQSLSTGDRTVLVEAGSNAHYLPTGHLVYASADGLLAVRFDPDSLTVAGGAVSLVQGILRATGNGAANYGVSKAGTLAYAYGGAGGNSVPVWVDRQGQEELLSIEPSEYVYPRISPNGRLMVLDDRNPDDDLWVWDFANETRTRLTLDGVGGGYPTWNPGGTHIAYDPNTGDIYWKSANNTGRPERLTTGASSPGFPARPYFFASDNELVFRRSTDDPETNNDICMILIGDDGSEPDCLLEQSYRQLNAELHPSGNWMAYQSDESGDNEIYVRPFPGVDGDLVPVSNAGGLMPLWSRDGQELFYLEPGSPERLISVSIQAADTEFSIGPRTAILPWSYIGTNGPGGRPYDVSFDGQKFLAIKDSATGAQEQIIIVQNWFEELERLVPTE